MLKKPIGITKWAQELGYFRSRNLFWSWYEPRNFGDWIGPYLFQKFTGKSPLYCGKSLHSKTTCIFAAGSILRHLQQPDCATIWGAGIVSRSDTFAKPKDVLAVRGPESRDAMIKLGYECPSVYGDPGVLLPLFVPSSQKHKGRIGIIPHFIEHANYQPSDFASCDVIDVSRPVEIVCADIASCELTYSSSLHGLIVSHAFNTPSIWMASSKVLDGGDVKFEDYLASCGFSGTKRNSLLDNPRIPTDELMALLPEHGQLQNSLLAKLPDGWKFR